MEFYDQVVEDEIEDCLNRAEEVFKRAADDNFPLRWIFTAKGWYY